MRIKRIVSKGSPGCSHLEEIVVEAKPDSNEIIHPPRRVCKICLFDSVTYVEYEYPEDPKSVEEIINGVFLHGRDTPGVIGRSELPEGHYTVQEAVEFINKHIKKGQSNV